ncbi:MAG: mechanosensitive ion channel family protein [Rhizobiaceae bacterium]|nr:mechanosensitive ion channel family protein [Rhizobiaceae bacterium]
MTGIAVSSIAFVSPGAAQEAATTEDSQQAKIREFVKLLDDPEIRAWLDTAPQTKSTAPTSVAGRLAGWDDALRDHLAAMTAAFKRLPAEAGGAVQRLAADSGDRTPGTAIILLLGLVAAGYAAEWLVKRMVSGARLQRQKNPVAAADDFAAQALSALAPVLVFTVVSLGVFLASGGPPLLRKVVLTYLVAFIAVRLVAVLSILLLDRLRAEREPMPDASSTSAALAAGPAAFWQRRIVLFAAYLMAAWATLSLLPAVGFSDDATQLLSYLAGIGLLALAIESVWRAPQAVGTRSVARKWLLTIYLVALWALWCIGLSIALWLGIYALLLPKVLSVAGQVAQSIVARWKPRTDAVSVRDVLVVRGVRAAVVLLAVLWLGFVLSINPGVLTSADTVSSQIIRGLLRSVVILIVADLIWQLIKTYVDRTIAVNGGSDPEATAEASRRGRLHTLLPIFRNALAVLIITIASLMVLSELGVEIGPLIAGAGIFGVAIGFGSQTLVKDIVSGVFYLMDDAFRVGEYIQSGNYKGTVESFSLRSIRLRHHRGPVFTVPFGSLGAIQNMSRDWAIDKFIIRVPFDTDIKLVKKLTKGVGAALLEDPEIAPDILQTVKMKGVEQFGDYGMELSFGVMTKPGYQTTVRRRAYSMIRDSFAANGIEFARPSVSVGSEDSPAAAGAASAVIARQKILEASQG